MRLQSGNPRAGAGLIAALLIAVTPAGAFDVPKHVYTFDRLPEAQNEGFAEEEPLLLLYADPKKEPT